MELEQSNELINQLIDKVKMLNINQQQKIISLVDTFLEEKQEYEEKISQLRIEKVKNENKGKLYKEQLSYSVQDIQEIVDLFPKNKKWIAEELEDTTIFPADLFVKIELLNYQLFIMARPTPTHQEILGNVFTYINMYVRKNQLGKVFVAPVGVHIEEGTTLEPDIVLVLNHNTEKITKKGIYEAPDLVIEVISPANYKKLREEKKQKYADFGVQEYWEIYPKKKKINIEVLEKSEDGKINNNYKLFSTAKEEGKIKSKVLEGFELDIESIF